MNQVGLTIYQFLIHKFSLGKIVLFLTLFMTLGSFFYQLFIVYPSITKAHPYSDVLIYQQLATGDLSFSGPTHITHRILFSYLLSLLLKFLPIPIEWTTALLHLSLLIIVFYWIEKKTDKVALAFFSFLLILIPSFYRGFFLPMSDTLSWALITLTWLFYLGNPSFKRNSFLFLFIILAAFTKEMNLLMILFFLFDKRLNNTFPVFALVIAFLTYLFFLLYPGNSIHNNYLFNPNLWLNDWQNSITHQLWFLPKYLISGFGGLFVVFALRMYSKSNKWSYYAPEMILFIIVFLFSPTNSPRLIFPFTGIITLRLLLVKYRFDL